MNATNSLYDVPGQSWDRFADPTEAGFPVRGIRMLEDFLYELPTTSLLVVRDGKIAYSYGDISQPSYLASVRKSVLSMLYGRYVMDGTINLDLTLEKLGIAEHGGLSPAELSATIRDLLTSSSGVYAPAGSPGGNDSTPPRGSRRPGEHFHYNNWDFNVAGTVFAQLTGRPVLQALATDLAEPLGMQDFDPARQRMLGYEAGTSMHQAYHMFLSARDLARLGWLMMNNGWWNGRQVIPAAWVQDSTAPRFSGVQTADSQRIGYGYLWWLPDASSLGSAWNGSYMARGHFGQSILCLPAARIVVVHRRAIPDELAVARNLGRTKADIPSVSVKDQLRMASILLDRLDEV